MGFLPIEFLISSYRKMKEQIIITFIILTVCVPVSFGQYISTVTYPDKKTNKITDVNDPAYRIASMISTESLKKHLYILASDEMEGRETGQKGIKMASDYLQSTIKNIGLMKPSGSDEYFQSVAFTFSKWKESSVKVNNNRYRHLWDYIMIHESNETMPELNVKEVVFLGYGIEDPKYNDYKKTNVKDKVILINKGEPIDKDGNYIISGNKNASAWKDDINKKLTIAKEKGAKLVLIIEEDVKKLLEENRRKLLGGSMQLGNGFQKTIYTANHIFISSTIAKDIIGLNEEEIIKARQKIAKGKPSSYSLSTDLGIKMDKEMNVLEGQNVIGYIKGKSKPEEYIIVSAHYDHLGKRGDEVFNGANDNGSGTVAILGIAEALAKAVREGFSPERSIVFLWVCGEEKGLLGSEYYSENPVFPLDKTILNVNVDMVGRSDEKYTKGEDFIYIIGSDRLSSDVHKINESVNQKYSQMILDYTYNSEEDPNRYYYRSDHYNFAKKGIPAIFYFNGTHADYHRTTDDVEKINFELMRKTAQLILHTTWEVANRPERIVVDGVVK